MPTPSTDAIINANHPPEQLVIGGGAKLNKTYYYQVDNGYLKELLSRKTILNISITILSSVCGFDGRNDYYFGSKRFSLIFPI